MKPRFSMSMNFYDNLRGRFESRELEGKTAKQIFNILGIHKGFEKDVIRETLLRLERDMVIFESGGRYVLFENAGLIKGTIRAHEQGYAFLVPENAQNRDLFLPHRALNGAYHGDVVYVKRVAGTHSDEAEVVRIVERRTVIVGTFEAGRNHAFVIPDEREYDSDIYIPFSAANGAVTGDKVVVDLVKFPFGKSPEGVVREVLGRRFDTAAEEKSILAAKGIPVEFPEDVRQFVAAMDTSSVAEEDLRGREDFRSEQIITIDGEDARDLDDAISLKTLDKGHFLLGVHIADVSHYVREKTPIDREAASRGTSVYFPDTVIPMLPRELSNGICSLNEGVDRLTLSCIMEVDGSGNVTDSRIVNGVIRSKRRMTYTAVDGILNGDGELCKEYADILQLVEHMRTLCGILIRKRDKRGSVDLDIKDAEIRVSAEGEISINPLNRTLSHRIIEEFMILANETVAEIARYSELPFIYRIHENPPEDKLESFISFLKQVGINVRWRGSQVKSYQFSALLDMLEGSPLYPIVNRAMLRSMSKAKYSDVCSGHFGLSSENYCHFTSPIRRYPDLIVHRALKCLISGGMGEWTASMEDKVAGIAESCSSCERRADEAERDADDLFKAKYMRKHIGEEFDGIVSGVGSFGVFVELYDTVEGLIRQETLPRGRYNFDRKSMRLYSDRLSLSIGERVRIRVAGVDMAARRAEFILLEKLAND